MPKKRRFSGITSRVESQMVRSLDKLARYEEIIQGLPKDLVDAFANGTPAEELYKQHANVAALRVLQILFTEKDSSKALSAARELLDRTYGKATERKVIKHQLEELSDNELDALLLSEIEES